MKITLITEIKMICIFISLDEMGNEHYKHYHMDTPRFELESPQPHVTAIVNARGHDIHCFELTILEFSFGSTSTQI